MKYLLATLILLLGACTTGVEPEDEDKPKESIEDPEVIPGKEFDVLIVYSYLNVKGDCDGDVLGIDNPGEIAYKIGYRKQRADNSWTAPIILRQSLNYGKESGETLSAKAGEKVSLEDLHETIRMSEGSRVRVYLWATEWDGNNADDRMNNKSGYHEHQAGRKLVWESTVSLGSGDCRVALEFGGVETQIIEEVVVD